MLTINNILENIDKRSDLLLSGNKEAYDGIIEFSKEIIEQFKVVLQNISQLHDYGISSDLVLSQIKNIEEGIRYKDDMLLIDTLVFEVYNTLSVSNNVIFEGGQK